MEPKRLELMTVGPVTTEKKSKKRIQTFRFNLTLTESTDKVCPEFSYSELVKNALGAEDDEDLDPLDPFAVQDRDGDDKLKAIAKSFEERYGTGIKPTGRKRKLKDHVGDLVDLGEGYDLEDPFIDNTEAYDEIVPCNMTTKLGGFYINSGALDFKFCSDSDDDFMPSKTKRKKRQITSDSESEGEEKKKKKKKLVDGEKKKKKKAFSTDSEGGDKILKKKKLVSSEKIKMNKLKKKNPELYWKIQVENMKRQKQAQVNKLVNGHNEAAVTTTSEPATSAAGSGDQNDVIVIEDNQSPRVETQGQQATTATASGANSQDGAAASEANTSTNKGGSTTPPENTNLDSAASSSQPPPKPKLESIPSLPDTLSLKTLSTVEKLKMAAKDTEAGKSISKFFSTEVNEMLLVVEKDSKQLSQSERSIIYSHLAGYLPCSKETLMKRAKKLVIDQQDDKLKEPKSKLKEAISEAMPPMLEKHQAECAAAEQLKQERSQTEKQKEGGGGSTESDEDNSKDGPEKQKRIVAPRKKFEWNPYIRQLLCTVVVIKMDHYETSKVRSQSPEEFLKAFLDAEIRPLWPQGWMQTRMLFKESRSVHGKWTNQQQKPKKPIVPTKNTSASSPAVAINTAKSNTATPANVNSSSANTSGTKPMSSTPMSAVKMEEKTKLLSISPSVFASPELPSVNKVKEEDSSKSVKSNKEGSATPTLPKKDPTVVTLLDYADKNYNSLEISPTKQQQQQASNALVSSALSLLTQNKNLHSSKMSKPPQSTQELLKHLVTGNVGSASSNLTTTQSIPKSRPNTPSVNTNDTSIMSSLAASILAGSSPGESNFLQQYKDFTEKLSSMTKQTDSHSLAKKSNPAIENAAKSTAMQNSSHNSQQVGHGQSSSNKSKLHLGGDKIKAENSISATKPVNLSLSSSQVLLAKQHASSYTSISGSATNATKSQQKEYHKHSSGGISAVASSGSSISTSVGNTTQGKPYVIKTVPATTVTSAMKKAVVAPMSVNPLLEQIAKEQSNMRKLQQTTKLLNKSDSIPKTVCVVTTKHDGTKQIHLAKPLIRTISPSQHKNSSEISRVTSNDGKSQKLDSGVQRNASSHQVSQYQQQSKEQLKNSSISKPHNQSFAGVSLQQIQMQLVQKTSSNSNKNTARSESSSPSAWSPSRRYSGSGGNLFTPPASVPSRTSPGYHSGLGQPGNPLNHASLNTSPERYSQGSPYGQQSGGHRSPHGSPVQSRSPQGLYPRMVGSPSPTRHPALGGQYHGFRYPNTDHSPQQYRY